MTKKFLEWSDFSTVMGAVDLMKESIRKGIEFDAFGGRTTFTAIALTDSYKLSDVEASGYGDATAGLTVGNGAKYKFKARILDDDSPHIFLPDPCSLAETEDQEAVVSAITRHTDFIQLDTGGAKVSMGDIVEVTLKKNVFSYDLQVGKFNRIIGTNSKASNLLKGIDCDTLVKNFGTMPTIAVPSVNLDGLKIVKKSKKNPHITEKQKNWLADLGAVLSDTAGNPWVADPTTGKPYITTLIVTSGYRDSKRTANTFWNMYHDPGRGPKYTEDLYKGSKTMPPEELKSLLATAGDPNGTKEKLARQFGALASRGHYISYHQVGRGVDLSVFGLNTKQVVSSLNKIRKRYGEFKKEWDNE